ncbi:rab-GTPase-TBC domain-containing protein, partial [Cladochytrium replicatum]
DEEFWKSIVADSESLHKIPALLTAKVRAGIPPQLRVKIWAVLSGTEVERWKEEYPKLLEHGSPFEKIIRRDVPRTFPKVDLFREENGRGQAMLYNLLCAYSIYDPEVGYCQGLSFLVGPLIMQNMTEPEAFAVLVRLMEDPDPDNPTALTTNTTKRIYGLRSLFTPQMTGLHELLYLHEHFLSRLFPPLHRHFQSHRISPSLYASQWFLTLFAYAFPFPLVFRIMDVLIAEGGFPTLLRFSLAVLQRNTGRLMEEEEMEGILGRLRGEALWEAYGGDTEAVVRD